MLSRCRGEEQAGTKQFQYLIILAMYSPTFYMNGLPLEHAREH